VPDEQRLDALVVRDLGQHGGVGRAQDEHALVVALDDQAPVPVDRLAQVDRDGGRHGEARPAVERLQHVLGGVPGRAGVPQTEPRDPVRVDVLGRALQLGEDRELVAGALGVGVGDLEEHGAVALDDQGAIRHS